MRIAGKFVPAGAVILGLIAFGVWDQCRYPYHIGEAQSCSGGALFAGAQAEIVEYGLQDARGISADKARKNVYIIEGNRHIVMYNEDSGKAEPALMNDDMEFMCPDGGCDDADARDVVIDGSDAYVVEHGKGRIFKGTLGNDGHLTSLVSDETDTPQVAFSPSGVGGSPQALAVSGETFLEGETAKADTNKTKGLLYIFPRPGKKQNEAAQNQSSSKKNEAQEKSKPDSQPAPPTIDLKDNIDQEPPKPAISTGLHRPSGVVWEESGKYVYVADDDDVDDAVRWSIFEQQGKGWVPAGLLASVPKMHQGMPKFLGIALEHEKQIIFAAGPMGLYAFRHDGESIGKISFDEPVSGVALTSDYIYLIVGHMLCRIPLYKLIEQEKKIKAYTPSPVSPDVKATTELAPAKSGQGEQLRATRVQPISELVEQEKKIKAHTPNPVSTKVKIPSDLEPAKSGHGESAPATRVKPRKRKCGCPAR